MSNTSIRNTKEKGKEKQKKRKEPDKKRSGNDEPTAKRRKTNEEKGKKPVTSAKPKVKQSEADIRNEQLGKGALLLQFTSTRAGLLPQEITRWRNVEKKGFLVTTKGCLIPADCHLFTNRSKSVGYDCALSFFNGQIRDPATVGTVNQYGWDCEEQVSHLCHRSPCCSFKHLELCPRWKNMKRNYCGLNGTCDCGLQPPCVATYCSNAARPTDDLLTYSTPNVGQLVRDMFDTDSVKVKILQKNHFATQDKKHVNRNKRIKGSKKTFKEKK
jgi:hypothetical protein